MADGPKLEDVWAKVRGTNPKDPAALTAQLEAYAKERIAAERKKANVVLPCAVCGEPGKVRCGKCKTAVYCRKECQQSHWKQHKKECCNLLENPRGATPKDTWCKGAFKSGTQFYSELDQFRMRNEATLCHDSGLRAMVEAAEAE